MGLGLGLGSPRRACDVPPVQGRLVRVRVRVRVRVGVRARTTGRVTAGVRVRSRVRIRVRARVGLPGAGSDLG